MNELGKWHVMRVTPQEYEKIVLDRKVFFNEPRFCELNSTKVDSVHYLIVMKNDSARFGIILGQLLGVMKCPFSAPYSYPVEIRKFSKIEDVDCALEVLEEYCKEQKVHVLKFTFPPLFYDEHLLSAWVSSFYRRNYQIDNLDINYALNLKMLCKQDNYIHFIPEKGRKSLKKSQKIGLTIQQCKTDIELREAYQIIKENHEVKNRPVRLTFEQLMDTLNLVGHDVFIVKHENKSIAAEFLYHINERIVQGIYCGVIPNFTNYNGMNFLTDYTIYYYYKKGYEILDKAIATEDTIPNYGLCNFKESVGCMRNLKFSFSKEFL